MTDRPELKDPSIVQVSELTRRGPDTPLQRALRQLSHNRLAIAGGIIIGLLTLMAVLAPVLAPYNPTRRAPEAKRRTPPCVHLLGCPAEQPQFLFGTDSNSRDLLSRVIYGAQISLRVGILAVAGAVLIGGFLGAVAGYAGGWLDNAVMRVMDVLLAFPSLLLAIAIVNAIGRADLNNTLLAIGIVSIPVYARVMRSSVIAVKEFEYITAARAIGANAWRILFRQILPNALAPILVTGTLGIAGAILDAAALSFLGLGAQPPDPEWGRMLSDERSSVNNAPYLLFFPGAAIMLTVLGFNLLGDGLRDALDPRLRHQ